MGGFPAGLVVKTRTASVGAWVQSPARTKIPHAMLCDQKKKKEKKKQGQQERAKSTLLSRWPRGETPRAQTSTWLWRREKGTDCKDKMVLKQSKTW